MAQADILRAVEGGGGIRVFCLPEGEHHGTVADKDGRVVWIATHLGEIQLLLEEVAGLVDVAHGQAEMVNAPGDIGCLVHNGVLWFLVV